MNRPGSRPFRAVVYLPGHGEGGHLVSVKVVTAATEEGLARALERWTVQGYETKSWEEVALPLDELGE